jgi:hypothetical protein
MKHCNNDGEGKKCTDGATSKRGDSKISIKEIEYSLAIE